jgi:hypothetical protein
VTSRTHEHIASGLGTAYIFHRSGDAQWQQIGEFPAPAGSDNFGLYADMDDTQAAVSGIHRVNLGPGPRGTRGFVNIYEQVAPQLWQQTQRLIIPPPVNPQDDAFGFSVALDEDRVLIGAPGETEHGAAYIYERNVSGQWIQSERITARNPHEHSGFGRDVALEDDLALVSSWSEAGTEGQVHLFQQNDTGEWLIVNELRPSDAHASFGNSLTIFERQLFVGAGINTTGAVHVFSEIPEPTTAVNLFGLGTFFIAMRTRRVRSELTGNPGSKTCMSTFASCSKYMRRGT